MLLLLLLLLILLFFIFLDIIEEVNKPEEYRRSTEDKTGLYLL